MEGKNKEAPTERNLTVGEMIGKHVVIITLKPGDQMWNAVPMIYFFGRPPPGEEVGVLSASSI